MIYDMWQFWCVMYNMGSDDIFDDICYMMIYAIWCILIWYVAVLIWYVAVLIYLMIYAIWYMICVSAEAVMIYVMIYVDNDNRAVLIHDMWYGSDDLCHMIWCIVWQWWYMIRMMYVMIYNTWHVAVMICDIWYDV